MFVMDMLGSSDDDFIKDSKTKDAVIRNLDVNPAIAPER